MPNVFIPALLAVTFMTKSALFPFSPWLPLAMAAPTPISALVHSSTLVTAGLYLMIRYSYILSSSLVLMQVLLTVSIFTSFYAGMNAVFEVDLKKLIALSTLRHLGFIGSALFSGMFSLAFFHLLTHALFKSLLFIRMGDVMTNLTHSQDIRYLSAGGVYTPASSAVIAVSLVNLLGLPSLSGFFSKDLILEIFIYTASAWIMVGCVFLNIFFTYFYTLQLLVFSRSTNKLSSYLNVHRYGQLHRVLLLILRLATLFFGRIFLDVGLSSTLFIVVPLGSKLYPLSALAGILVYVFCSLALSAPKNIGS